MSTLKSSQHTKSLLTQPNQHFYTHYFFASSEKKTPKIATMVSAKTIVAFALTQLAITVSAGDCKNHLFYCGSTLKNKGKLFSLTLLQQYSYYLLFLPCTPSN